MYSPVGGIAAGGELGHAPKRAVREGTVHFREARRTSPREPAPRNTCERALDENYRSETFRFEHEHWWYRARRKVIMGMFHRCFCGRKDLRILDIGCGAGTILKGLSVYGEAVGLDECPEAVEKARRWSGCEVRLGSIPSEIPSDIGHYDVVCLFDVIEHLSDDGRALGCACGLLKPGGCVFLTVPAVPWIYGIHDEINGHQRRYDMSSLYSTLRKAGFRRIQLSYFNSLLAPALIPAILYRNRCRQGHHFEVRTRLAPILEYLFGLERFLVGYTHLPWGLSLAGVAARGRESH